MADQKPGKQIREWKEQLKDVVIEAVQKFEDEIDVHVQSVHYYVGEPDRKMLDSKPKLKVDIILKL